MGEELVPASADLFWLPLGAGGHVVRWNGLLYERWTARCENRASVALFHCGLMLRLDDITYAVEMGPVWNVSDGGGRAPGWTSGLVLADRQARHEA